MSRRRLFGSLCVLVFTTSLARVVFAPLIPPLSAAFGVTPGSLGVVASAAWLGSALPRIPVGWLLTRVARHRVIAASGALLTASAAATAVAPSVPALAAGALAMGIASGAYFIAANPLVSELFPEGVGRAIGIHGTAAQLAAVGAPLVVGGTLAVGNWRLTFLFLAVAAAAATAGTVLAARGATLPTAGSEDRDLLAAVRAQWPIVCTGVAIAATVGFVWNGVFNFYPTYMETVKGLSRARARDLLTVVFAAGVPAFLVTGRLADRLPNLPLLLVVIAAFVCLLLALPAVSGLGPLLVASAVLGYVIHSLFPVLDTYMLGSLPDGHRASAYTVYSGTMMLVGAQGSVVVGGLLDRGVAFDWLLVRLAAALALVCAALTALYLDGRLPAGRTPSRPAGEASEGD
ncbi:MAG: MFS transporter [Haloarculaceae archaeon]